MHTLTFDNGIVIDYDSSHDGGGSTQYTDFLDHIKSTGKKYKHCLEWCSGLGAIGYSLLDAGICETVTFMDIHEPSIENALRNAEKNNVSDKVKAYHLDKIGDLPKDLKFDLVVGNPPHSPENPQNFKDDWERKIIDPNWDTHTEFYATIGEYLEPNSDIILSEIENHSISKVLITMAESYGLKFNKIAPAPELAKTGTFNGALHLFQN